jgi:hypothetical protein
MHAHVSEITRNYEADEILRSAYADCQEMIGVCILSAIPYRNRTSL